MTEMNPSVSFQLPELKTKKVKSKSTQDQQLSKTPVAKTLKKPENNDLSTVKASSKIVKVEDAPGKIDILDHPAQYDIFQVRWFLSLHGTTAVIQFALLVLTILLSNWSISAPVFSTILINERNFDFVRAKWTRTTVYLLPIFVYLHTVSFIFHMGTIFLWRRPYLRWRQDAISPLRWLHTILTSPVRTGLVIYAAGIREGSAIALIFIIRVLTHIFSLSNELVSRTVNGISWSIGQRTRFSLMFLFLFGAFLIWITCVAFIINAHIDPMSVSDTFGIALFAAHTLFIIISYANHAIFLMQSPNQYYKSEYIMILSETSDMIVISLLFLTQIMQKEFYTWDDKYWTA